MSFLYNKVICIQKGLNDYLYGKNPDAYIITDNMISEEYSLEDYPEFFI
jgi:hypothetical protein